MKRQLPAFAIVFIFTCSLRAQVPAFSLCYITVDSLSENILCVWEKPVSDMIDSFRVYRETGGVYKFRKALPYSAYTAWRDTTVDPNTSYVRYKLSLIDTLGVETPLSNYHSSIFLQASLGTGGVINLNWTPYEGAEVSYYRIMRDDNGTGNFVKLDSVPASNRLFTDNNPPSSNNAKYAIEVVWPATCGPSFKAQAASINTTRSNLKDKASIVSSSIAANNEAFIIKLYPNPNNGKFILENEGTSTDIRIKIVDVIGNEVFDQELFNPKTELDISACARGIYFVKIFSNRKQAGVKKMVVH